MDKNTQSRAFVVHWTGVAAQSAHDVRAYRNETAPRRRRYGPTHVIAADDLLLQVMPMNELAYHVSSSKGYTAFARQRFGTEFTSTSSPNRFCWGIEMCVENAEGEASDATLRRVTHELLWLAGEQSFARSLDLAGDGVGDETIMNAVVNELLMQLEAGNHIGDAAEVGFSTPLPVGDHIDTRRLLQSRDVGDRAVHQIE